MVTPRFLPRGVIPATLLALDDNMAIDEPGTRKHLRDVAAVRDLSAITVNGHASEVHACTFDEQQRVLAIALDEVGAKLPIVSGIYADGSVEAARLGKMAEREGAGAVLVFPPQTLAGGGELRPEMALEHYRRVAEATSLPIIAFVYAQTSGVMYPFETLLRMFEEIPSIRAIKDWCNVPMLHERHIRTFQSLPRPVSVLTTHSSWLLGSLAMGCDGVLSGAGSVAAELQVAMFLAVKRGDLVTAQAINQRYYPLAQAFYAPPFLDMHNRMKEALVLLGRLEKAVVRPPLMKLDSAEIEQIEAALIDAGLLPAQRAPASFGQDAA